MPGETLVSEVIYEGYILRREKFPNYLRILVHLAFLLPNAKL